MESSEEGRKTATFLATKFAPVRYANGGGETLRTNCVCYQISGGRKTEAMVETPKTCEAIIRTLPGRVLTVTVLSTRKHPLSFDSCAPASGKRAMDRIDERYEV